MGLSVFGRIDDFQTDDGVPVIDGVTLSRLMVSDQAAHGRPIRCGRHLRASHGQTLAAS